MQIFLVVLVLAAGAAVLGWIAWVSVQSLLQAGHLRRAGRQVLSPGESAAVYGAIRVDAPISAFGMRDLLWYRAVHQELRGTGKHRHWTTVGEKSEMAVFFIQAADREIEVGEFPNEIQGSRSRTLYGESSVLNWLGFGRRERTVVHWVPLLPEVTIVGRMERRGDRWAVTRDPKVGLLLSPHAPGKAAAIEALKGVGGLLFVAAGAAVAVFLMFTVRRAV